MVLLGAAVAGIGPARGAWAGSGSGTARATAVSLSKPTGTATGSSCGNVKRLITVKVTNPPSSGVLEISRSTSTGQPFVQHASKVFTNGEATIEDAPVTKSTTYHYKARVRLSSGSTWVSPTSEDITGSCG